MVKQAQFFFSYSGGKFRDLKKFNEYVDLKDCDTICEPFCGSCAFSIHSEYDIKKFIFNDIDNQLIDFLIDVKDGKLGEYLDYIKDNMSKYCKDNKPTIEWNLLRKNIDTNDKYKSFLLTKMSRCRKGILDINYKSPSKTYEKKVNIAIDKTKYENLINFYTKNDIELLNNDYSKVFDDVKDKENIFVFLDPPYLDSFNSCYKSFDKSTNDKKIVFDNTKMFIDILEFLKTAKCKIMLIINKNSITEFLYKDFIKGEYDKRYDLSKRITKHLIICNY